MTTNPTLSPKAYLRIAAGLFTQLQDTLQRAGVLPTTGTMTATEGTAPKKRTRNRMTNAERDAMRLKVYPMLNRGVRQCAIAAKLGITPRVVCIMHAELHAQYEASGEKKPVTLAPKRQYDSKTKA